MNYVYILEYFDKTLYTGWTTNLKNRINTHNKGKGAKYTRGRLPVKLLYYECFNEKGDALRRECEIKKMTKEKKLKLIFERKEIYKGEFCEKNRL